MTQNKIKMFIRLLFFFRCCSMLLQCVHVIQHYNISMCVCKLAPICLYLPSLTMLCVSQMRAMLKEEGEGQEEARNRANWPVHWLCTVQHVSVSIPHTLALLPNIGQMAFGRFRREFVIFSMCVCVCFVCLLFVWFRNCDCCVAVCRSSALSPSLSLSSLLLSSSSSSLLLY